MKFKILLIYFVFLQGFAEAGPTASCQDIFASPIPQPRTLSPQSNFWQYTRRWLNTKIRRDYLENPDEAVFMPLVKTDSKHVEVITFGKKVDERILRLFVNGDEVYWPQHPNNTAQTVPFYSTPPSGKTLETRYSASRSLLSAVFGIPAFSVKAGTNRPHLKRAPEYKKEETSGDVDGAALLQPYLNFIETAFEKKDDSFFMVPELFALRERSSGEGAIVRDLSVLDNNKIYVPALSLPYLGREIAAKNGAQMDFWVQHYATLLGVVQARQLIMYGVDSANPNPQNIFIELDQNFHPTGRLALIDIGDYNFYGPWLQALGLNKITTKCIALGEKPFDSLMPEDLEETFIKDFISEYPMPGAEFEGSVTLAMLRAHPKAWVNEIKRLLEINDDRLKRPEQIDEYLHSEKGMQALLRFHERQGTLKLLQDYERRTFGLN